MSPPPWAAHFGLSRTPFGKSIAARDLFPRQAHAEAIARISFCIVESALGVVMGDVGAGKTVALRATVDGLDPTRHQVIYIANPAFSTRGLYVSVVRALGGRPPVPQGRADGPGIRPARRRSRRTAQKSRGDPGRGSPGRAGPAEELRLMLNADMDSASPFAAILAGQPTLNRQLRMGTFAALETGSRPGSRSSRWTSPSPPPTCATACGLRQGRRRPRLR